MKTDEQQQKKKIDEKCKELRVLLKVISNVAYKNQIATDKIHSFHFDVMMSDAHKTQTLITFLKKINFVLKCQ